jgi:long-chain acyl-CoA synthetase
LGSEADQLAEQVSEIVHGAASVSFSLDLDSARAINVHGTRHVLDFARRCQARGGVRRMSYISTAYVCGDHRGCFSEDELDVGQEFRNTYEQSKFEAETLVRAQHGELPITVLRPSIIVGERKSGWTTSFNVLYWPLRAYARGSYTALPARGGCLVDAVAVDYVADAILHLTRAREAEGATFHLTAGSRASTVTEIVELAAAFFERPAPRLIDPTLYRRVVHPLLLRMSSDERQRRALRRSEAFFPYFAVASAFDERRTRVALRATGLSPTPLSAYFNKLIEFALAAEWGKRKLPHPRSYELTAASRLSESASQWRGPRRGAADGRRRLALAQ